MVVVMLLVLGLFDLFLNPRVAYNIRNHVVALVFMLFASIAYGVLVWKQRGSEDGVAWFTGYFLEWALSMDNLFVFHVVFRAFSVPNDQSTRALTIGIYGAVCFRLAFIVGLTQLFQLSYAVDIAIGALLIFSGILALGEDEEEEEVHNQATVRFFKWLFGSRLLDRYSEDGALFLRSETGELQMTVLFLVVCVVSVVDCIFAMDSVGSKTGQIKNIYINVTSCLMAMFSLRSLFFIVRDMADYFEYVKYGICAILCFVGTEMIVSKWCHVPLGYMCLIIAMLFSASVLTSVVKVRSSEAAGKDGESPKDSPAVSSLALSSKLAPGSVYEASMLPAPYRLQADARTPQLSGRSTKSEKDDTAPKRRPEA